MATALESLLEKFLQQTLQYLPIVVETTNCSYSQVCLAWPKSTKTLKTFVRNQVNVIYSYKCSCFFNSTNLNPAYIATRISQPKDSRQELWWHGPSRRVLEGLKTTHQDVSEPLENAVFMPKKQEDRTEVNPKIPLKQKLNPIQQDRVAPKIPLPQTTRNAVKESQQYNVNPKVPCIKTT